MDEEWRALMYGEEEEPILPKSEVMPQRGIINMPAMSAEIRRLRAYVDEQDRIIKRMARRLSMVEKQVNGSLRDINSVWDKLDDKIDRKNG